MGPGDTFADRIGGRKLGRMGRAADFGARMLGTHADRIEGDRHHARPRIPRRPPPLRGVLIDAHEIAKIAHGQAFALITFHGLPERRVAQHHGVRPGPVE